ncbi:proline--tRNA ligase [Candidatus Profftia tarda]|nr:proline--tRNA ligase [Candidatus Profftia tarda]
MLTSKYVLSTMKETPCEAESISHKLMLRAGMIRKLASGLYTWMPTGLRVLKKIENIIREEMENTGALEVLMPLVQPADLWQASGRLEQYGPELLRFLDRGKRVFVLGPTHEEVITYIVRHEIHSYKQLPLNFFQIQTKFRDELRPRSGIMRSREFIMKDAYSFHASQASLQETYDQMFHTYNKIFQRIHLDVRPVQADNGSIGGNISHEFQVLANSGEDIIVLSSGSNYAANLERAESVPHINNRFSPTEELRIINTPNTRTLKELGEQFDIPVEKTVKTILVHANKKSSHKLVALIVRGDHEIAKTKAEKLSIIKSPLTFATKNEIRTVINAGPNFLGPIKMIVPIIIDRTVAMMSDFIAGANIDGKHYFGINWVRDLPLPIVADIRYVVAGDPSPDGKGTLLFKRGIEVGHTFQLGTKYTKALKATVQSRNDYHQIITMGCYGIGVSRLVAAYIEQNHDERGIIWPCNIAPFQVAIIPINMHKYLRVNNLAESLYKRLDSQGIDVIIDDRKERPGVMFADMDVIGVPHSIIISNEHLDNDEIEYKHRLSKDKRMIKINAIENFLSSQLKR